MAVRFLFLFIAFLLAANILLITLGYALGVNLYRRHGRGIGILFSLFMLGIIGAYVVLGFLGLE
jgi:ABC-type molybdate transport system permease subunit